MVGPAVAPGTGGLPDGVRPGGAIDRYAVIEELGRGGMGVVLRAYDPKLRREVALKVVRRMSADAEARLVLEAQAMAQLNHPNVVAVYDVVVGDAVVLAMEYVAGTTLGQWLEDTKRSPEAIVAAYVEAGRGLAAAHREGLLHRDFKPANVLVGEDQRVRVTDFGLARFGDPETSGGRMQPVTHEGDDVSGSGSGRLTQAGTVMGTPTYMAPEQHQAEPLTAAADQYALCVSLWASLCGTPPFKALGRDLLAAKLKGPDAWPRAVSVASGVADAVRKGLSPNPDDRHATIDALLVALTPRPNHAARWVGLAAGAVALTAVGAWGARESGASASLCTGAADKLGEIWGEAQRAQLESDFARSEASFAPEVWTRQSKRIDSWASEWVDAHEDACTATRIRGEQSEAAMDLRMECLHRARHDLRAAVDVLAEPSPEVVMRAHRIVGGLPPLSQCADLDSLRASVRPPPKEHVAAVDAIRSDLADAEAKANAADFDTALVIARRAESASAQLDYEPIRAQSWLALGDALVDLAEYEEAETWVRRAVDVSVRIDHRVLATDSTLTLMSLLAKSLKRPAEGLALRDVARGLSMGSPAGEAHYHQVLAMAQGSAGRFDEAVAEQRRALEILEETLAPGDPRLATVRANIGLSLYERGDHAEAEAELQAVIELHIAALGEGHPQVARALTNLGSVVFAQGKHDEAIAVFQRAVKLWLASMGPDHPDTAAARNNLGAVYCTLGRFEECEREFEASFETRERRLGADHVDTIGSRVNLAGIAKERGHVERAESMYREAIESYTRVVGAEHVLVANVRNNLGNALRLRERFEEAGREYAAAQKIYIAAFGLGHEDVTMTRHNLATVDQHTGNPGAAEAKHRLNIEARTKLWGPNHKGVAQSRDNLGSLLVDRGEYTEGEVELRAALDVRVAVLGTEHTEVARSRTNLGAALAHQGRLDEAEKELRAASAIWDAAFGSAPADHAATRGSLARVLAQQGRAKQAEAEFRAALAVADKQPEAREARRERNLELAAFLRKQGQPAQAEAYEARAQALAQGDDTGAQ